MIILSIHPEFVKKIRSGEKRFEFRKRAPARIGDDPFVLVYSTAPESAVVGYFRVGRTLALSPTALWEQTKAVAGISRARFRSYFRGRQTAYALEIAQWMEFTLPCSLRELCGTTPPQSFAFLDANQRQSVLRRETKRDGNESIGKET